MSFDSVLQRLAIATFVVETRLRRCFWCDYPVSLSELTGAVNMNTHEEAERCALFQRACYFLVQAEGVSESDSKVPSILYSVKAVLCALAGVLMMNGKRCPPFVTALDLDIPKIMGDPILNMRDTFLAEFVSTGKLDGNFESLLQPFLETASITRTLATSEPDNELVARTLRKHILPMAHEIVGRLARFSGHDPLG